MGAKIGVTFFCAFLLSTATMATESLPRTVTTYGKGVITAIPDQATVPMELQAENKNSATAKSSVDKQFNRLLNALKDAGLSEEKITAGTVRLYPQYNYKNQMRRFTGYKAIRHTTITIDNLENLSQIIDTSLEVGIAQIGDISFGLSNKKEFEDRARQMAIEDSKVLAKQLAEAYGAKLGRIMQIKYSDATDPNFYSRPMTRFGEDMSTLRTEGATAGVYLPDTVTFSDRVQVVFELL